MAMVKSKLLREDSVSCQSKVVGKETFIQLYFNGNNRGSR